MYGLDIRGIFQSIGLYHYINGNIDLKTFNKFYGEYSANKTSQNILNKSSLSMYSEFTIFRGRQPYLCNIDDFQASRLKLLARTDCLPINSTLLRMKLASNNLCQMCTNNVEESITHLLLECPAYANFREKAYQETQNVISEFLVNVCFPELSPLIKLQFIIGDLGFMINEAVGKNIDKISKVFLVDIVSERTFVLNTRTNDH